MSRILVVGDVMLDETFYGTADRVSPEAPVIVLKYEDKKYSLGGAANVAANIASLGGQCALMGRKGYDYGGVFLSEFLKKQGITDLLAEDRNRLTTVKQRFFAGSQMMLRMDVETTEPLAPFYLEGFQQSLENIKDISLVVISDYAKGVCTRDLLLAVFTFAHKRGLRVIVDPKGDWGGCSAKYAPTFMADPIAEWISRAGEMTAGPYLITPNVRECEQALHRSVIADDVSCDVFQQLRGCVSFGTNILVTQGAHGMVLYEPSKKRGAYGGVLPEDLTYYPALARHVVDVSGAGDTVIAALAVALNGGACLRDAVEFASGAAAVAVSKPGVATVTNAEIEEFAKCP